MPLYDYICATCSGFRAWRPMSEAAAPGACPTCGKPAPRAVAAPQIATMDTRRRKARAVAERSGDQPGVVRREDVPHLVERDRHAQGPRRPHRAHGPYPWVAGH